MDKLKSFYEDKVTKETLLEFLVDYMNQYALDKMYKREDVSGIANAKEIIDSAFEQLDILYGIPATKKETISTSK